MVTPPDAASGGVPRAAGPRCADAECGHAADAHALAWGLAWVGSDRPGAEAWECQVPSCRCLGYYAPRASDAADGGLSVWYVAGLVERYPSLTPLRCRLVDMLDELRAVPAADSVRQALESEARIIGAAPDLLVALRHLMSLVHVLTPGHHECSLVARSLRIAQAALDLAGADAPVSATRAEDDDNL